MPSLVVAVPLLASMASLASGQAFPMSPAATWRPSPPGPYVPSGPYATGARAALPIATPPPGQKQSPQSTFPLTQVPAATGTPGTPTSPDKCFEVAARITPQLTPKPTYPPSLKALADKIGGVESDNCGELDLGSKTSMATSSDLNRFTQERYNAFIVPIWSKVHELWSACGKRTEYMRQVMQEPCYRWALELSQAGNGTSVEGSAVDDKGDNKGDDKGDEKAQQKPTAGRYPQNSTNLTAGSQKVSILDAVVVGTAGLLAIMWAVVLG